MYYEIGSAVWHIYMYKSTSKLFLQILNFTYICKISKTK